MIFYFISSDQQRFIPFQQIVSAFGECYVVKDIDQLNDILSDDKKPVFFAHLLEPQEFATKCIKAIRKACPAARIINVIQDSKGFDLKKHQLSPSFGDAYLSIKSDEDGVKESLISLGVLADDAPPTFEARNLDSEFSNSESLVRFANHAMSKEMDSVFRHLAPQTNKQPTSAPSAVNSGVSMSDNKNDESGLSLVSDFGDLSLSDGPDIPAAPLDEGMDLMLADDGDDLSLSDATAPAEAAADDFNLIGLDDDESSGASLGESLDEPLADSGDLGSLDFSDTPDLPADDNGLDLSDDIPSGGDLDLSSDDALETDGLSFDDLSNGPDDSDDLSEDAKEKLREIDAIMESTSSQIMISPQLNDDDEEMSVSFPSLDEPLVSDDLDLDSLDFSGEAIEEEKPKKKKETKAEKVEKIEKAEKTVKVEKVEAKASKEPAQAESMRPLAAELKEISGAYTVEMERAQATIANLRTDRTDLLTRIQNLEEDKMLHNRQTLTIRAELDEKKIELSIIRKKLNEEITELKDRLKFHDERKMILEEKNKILSQELEKAGQRNKIDLKKVQMRERELEQKLELLKSDAETQIRHRDLKILELKRKIDAMEFDMESISNQEKKSVESRYELEDKLDKAIKTLRSAITVLEDESDRDSAVQALKKNIDV